LVVLFGVVALGVVALGAVALEELFNGLGEVT
jgi:hypothetical protein